MTNTISAVGPVVVLSCSVVVHKQSDVRHKEEVYLLIERHKLDSVIANKQQAQRLLRISLARLASVHYLFDLVSINFTSTSVSFWPYRFVRIVTRRIVC